jgi:hypothetical protein
MEVEWHSQSPQCTSNKFNIIESFLHCSAMGMYVFSRQRQMIGPFIEKYADLMQQQQSKR